jgi:predicted lactoylglutathione lyase
VSTAFYERLGFVKSTGASQASISFFRAGGVVLALYGRADLAEDIGLAEVGMGQGQVTLAQNLESEAAVDAFLARAAEAGATILKPAEKVFWGGYSGYFADPDGHVWEVAHNPFFPLDAAGTPQLPD